MESHVFRSRPVVQLRVPFTLSRAEIDGVERGSKDADWDPLKDAAQRIAFAEDRAILDGYGAAAIDGVRPASSNLPIAVPSDVDDVPEAGYLLPPLTTVRQDFAALGGLMMQKVLIAIEEPENVSVSTPLPTTLVVRKSTRGV